jgi:beta-lactamase class A
MVIHKHIFLAVILILLLTIVCTSLITHAVVSRTGGTQYNSTQSDQFINPVVTSNLHKHFIVNFQPLRAAFLDLQKKYRQKTHIYFAYLNNAAWVGINERDMFTAASTVKVPLAMSVYKAIEAKKLTENDQVMLEQSDIDNAFGELYKEGPGKAFTVGQLIEIMLTKSDNTAANALKRTLERIGITGPLDDVYQAMGWEFQTFGQAENYGTINVKLLSNMFLALYNATYVDPEHSETILKYLTQTPFKEKIVAGIPNSVPVAHKVGVYENSKTFSDCGIVYAPNRSYLLCVSSVGANEQEANKFISEISRTVYTYVINH